MGTRMKLLTVGLVLVTAAMAGCSSTTGSSGAIQDEVPQGASCADGGVCVVGDSGPGGGVVFYASLTAFACGANMASKCNYLESAPNLWNPDSKISCKAATGTSCGGSVQETSDFSSTGLGFPWCTGSGGTASIDQEFHNGDIGTGFANTTVMLPVCNPGDAGNVARSYTGGGLTDWSLASLLELSELYFYNNRAAIGGFNSGSYWSSSQGSAKLSSAHTFSSGGGVQGLSKSITNGVRPIRAF